MAERLKLVSVHSKAYLCTLLRVSAEYTQNQVMCGSHRYIPSPTDSVHLHAWKLSIHLQ